MKFGFPFSHLHAKSLQKCANIRTNGYKLLPSGGEPNAGYALRLPERFWIIGCHASAWLSSWSLGTIERVMQIINPKRVLLIVAPILFVAFFLGTSFAGYLTRLAAPYLVFGFPRGQGISVVKDHRHVVTFSDGSVVHGLRLLPLDLVWALLSAVFVVGSFFVFIRVIAWFIRSRDPALADSVSHFWRLEQS